MRRKKKYIPRRGGANRRNRNRSWKVLETGEGPGVSPQYKGNERNGGKMADLNLFNTKSVKVLGNEKQSLVGVEDYTTAKIVIADAKGETFVITLFGPGEGIAFSFEQQGLPIAPGETMKNERGQIMAGNAGEHTPG